MKQHWILGSFRRDFLFLTFPGLVAIAFAAATRHSQDWVLRIWIASFVYICIDSGHVYTTMWRTYLQPSEFRDKRKLYLATPLVFMLAFFIWVYAQLPGLWELVVYGTLFHNFRQLWGFLRWYEKIEGRKDPNTGFFFHAFILIPIIAFHVNPSRPKGYYYVDSSEMFHFPSELAYKGCLIAYGAVFLVFLLHELQNYRAGLREPGRLLGLITAIVLYGYGPLFGTTFSELILPLVASHGIAYMAVMSQTTGRLGHTRWSGFRQLLIVMIVTAVGFGVADGLMQWWLMDEKTSYLAGAPNALLALGTALSLGPLYSHYLFDAFLWKKSHRDAPVVFSASPAGQD